jgi:putative ABC transport system ATP-binding protein
MIHCSALAYDHAGGSRMAFPDIEVAQGGALLVRGPSGSGKSTWLALAGALLRPSRGQITVAGQDLAALAPAQSDAWRAKAIGFLPQRLHLSAALTVQANLELAFFASGQPNDASAVDAALQALGVADLRHRKPSQLSGGQAQRVALARAVLRQPQVILADEPTASLDDASARAALDLLQDAARRCGATLVVATHDARVVQSLPQAAVLQLQSKMDSQVSWNGAN